MPGTGRGRLRGSLLGAVQGAALAVLAYLALYELGVTKLAGLRFLTWLWASAAAGAGLGAAGLRPHGAAPREPHAPGGQEGRLARRLLWGAAVAAAALMLVVTSTPLVVPLAGAMVRRDLPAGAPLPADVDGIAVLSGVLRDNGLVAEEGLERLLDALALARATRRPLLVSVIRPPGHPEASSLPDQQALGALAGVTLLTVDSVFVTRDEAVRMAAVARRERWRRVALVTSPMHSRRACATFERVGVRVVCVPSRSRAYVMEGPHPLPPGSGRLRAFAAWMYEALGLAVYRARGWV